MPTVLADERGRVRKNAPAIGHMPCTGVARSEHDNPVANNYLAGEHKCRVLGLSTKVNLHRKRIRPYPAKLQTTDTVAT